MNYELSGECIGIELTTTLDYLRVRVRWKDECLPWDIAGRFADVLEHRRGDLWEYKKLSVRRDWNKTVIQIGTAPLSISPDMEHSIAESVRRFYGSYLLYRTRINLPTLDYFTALYEDETRHLIPIPIVINRKGFNSNTSTIANGIASFVGGDILLYQYPEHQYISNLTVANKCYLMILCPTELLRDLIWACKQGVDIDWDTLKEWAKNPDDERNVILSLLEEVL